MKYIHYKKIIWEDDDILCLQQKNKLNYQLHML